MTRIDAGSEGGATGVAPTLVVHGPVESIPKSAILTPQSATEVVLEVLLTVAVVPAFVSAVLVRGVVARLRCIHHAHAGLVARVVYAVLVVIVWLRAKSTTTSTKTAVSSKCTSYGVTPILPAIHTRIVSTHTIAIPGKSAIAVASPTGEASLAKLLSARTNVAKVLLILFLRNDFIPKLVHVPTIWPARNRPRHAIAPQLRFLGLNFRPLELDFALCVSKDAVITGSVGLFGNLGEAVAEFGDRSSGEIGRGYCSTGAAAGRRLVGVREVAASAASSAIACCEGLRTRTGCADGMAAAVDPRFTHVER